MRVITGFSAASIVLGLLVGVPLAQAEALPSAPGPVKTPSTSTAALSYVPGEVLVTFASEATGKQKRHVRAQASGARVTARSNGPERVAPDLELIQLAPGAEVDEAISDLEDQPGVVAVEPSYILHAAALAPDPYVVDGSLWGLYGSLTMPSNAFGSNAVAAWDADYTGSDEVYVAVIDEVVDVAHPDLAGNIWVNAAEANGMPGSDDDGNGVIDDLHGLDAVTGTGITDSTHAGDHGTHVAGTIGAVGGNDIGVSGSPPMSHSSPSAHSETSAARPLTSSLPWTVGRRLAGGLHAVFSSNFSVPGGSDSHACLVSRQGVAT